MNGSSNVLVGLDSSVAVPRRSSSRSGIEAVPVSARPID